jgi:hypothetical protein
VLAVTLIFLTPVGAAVAAAVIVPLAGLALHERRLRRLRGVLRLEQPPLRDRAPSMFALAAVPILIALALTQPVLRSTKTQFVRTDAQAVYIFDVSRSMLASSGSRSPTRLQRAARDALRMQTDLGSVPAGVASMTDRVLPLVFPTSDQEVFAATLEGSLRIESPPPRGFDPVGTLFESLDAVAGTNLFNPGIKHRLAVVFTDGETRPYYVPTLREALAGKPHTDFVIVRVSNPGERIHNGEPGDGSYRSDPAADGKVAQLAEITHGYAFDENHLSSAIAKSRELLGTGPVEKKGQTLHVISLARWIALAALIPLAFVLWRRNLA